VIVGNVYECKSECREEMVRNSLNISTKFQLGVLIYFCVTIRVSFRDTDAPYRDTASNAVLPT